GWHRPDVAGLERVLRGDGGYCGGAVDSHRRERLEVGLDAGAAAGITAGDGERAWRLRLEFVHEKTPSRRGGGSSCPLPAPALPGSGSAVARSGLSAGRT